MKNREIDPQLAKQFGWWWREPDKALLPLCKAGPLRDAKNFILPPDSPPVLSGPELMSLKGVKWEKPTRKEALAFCRQWYVERWSECAFWYELHARRAYADKSKKAILNYEFGVPFPKVTQFQADTLARRWPAVPKKKVTIIFGDLTDPACGDALAHLTQLSESGYTRPLLISFNLKEFRDTNICKRIGAFLKIARLRRGIPEPKMNTAPNAKSKEGRSFRQIEALDVWKLLSRKEAEKTGIDEAQARDAKKLIRATF